MYITVEKKVICHPGKGDLSLFNLVAGSSPLGADMGGGHGRRAEMKPEQWWWVSGDCLVCACRLGGIGWCRSADSLRVNSMKM